VNTYVVAKRIRPSLAATPSKLFKSPLRDREFPSLSAGVAAGVVVEVVEVADNGRPVDFSSRDTDRVKAASRSSRRTIQREGTRPIKFVRVVSFILN